MTHILLFLILLALVAPVLVKGLLLTGGAVVVLVLALLVAASVIGLAIMGMITYPYEWGTFALAVLILLAIGRGLGGVARYLERRRIDRRVKEAL